MAFLFTADSSGNKKQREAASQKYGAVHTSPTPYGSVKARTAHVGCGKLAHRTKAAIALLFAADSSCNKKPREAASRNNGAVHSSPTPYGSVMARTAHVGCGKLAHRSEAAIAIVFTAEFKLQ